MTPKQNDDRVSAALARPDLVLAAMCKAARRAIALHRAYGRPLVVERNGQVVHLSPDEAERELDRQAPPGQG